MTRDPILDSPHSVQELPGQMAIQRTTWRAQRIGWWMLSLFTIAGAAGLLGHGPLAQVTDTTGEIRAQYERVLRRESESVVTFRLPAQGGRAVISLPDRYLEQAEISGFQPEPVAAFSGAERHFFVFAAPYAHTRVQVKIRPKRIGFLEFSPHVNGRPLTTRHPLVLP